MKNTLLSLLSIATVATLAFTSCKKSEDNSTPSVPAVSNQAVHNKVSGTNTIVWKSDSTLVRTHYTLGGGKLVVNAYKGDPVVSSSELTRLTADKFKAPYNGKYDFEISDLSLNDSVTGFFGQVRDLGLLQNLTPQTLVKGSFTISNYDATAGTMDIDYAWTQNLKGINLSIERGKFTQVKKK